MNAKFLEHVIKAAKTYQDHSDVIVTVAIDWLEKAVLSNLQNVELLAVIHCFCYPTVLLFVNTT